MKTARTHGGRRAAVALIVLFFLLLLLALPWLYLQFCGFPWDDYRSLAAENREPFDFADFTPEGELTLRLTKADLYSLLLEYAPPEQLLAEMPAAEVLRPELERLGFSLTPEEARLSLGLKVLGFLRLPLQLRLEAAEQGDGLLLTPKTVYIGPLVHISAKKLADLVRQPDLAEAVPLSPAAFGAPGVTLRAGEDSALLSLEAPPMLPDLLDLNVMRLSRLLAFYGTEDLPPAARAALGGGFTAAFREAIRDGEARELITSYLALGEEGASELLRMLASDLPEGILPEAEAVAARRQAAMEQLAAGQRRYESLLEKLRELYREGKLTLVPGGFRLEDRPLSLADLGWTGAEPGPWRAVYLYSAGGALPAATADMPQAASLPHTEEAALPEGTALADLGLLLPFPQGYTLLMYRTAAEELVLQSLPEETVRELLAAERTPTLLSDALPAPERRALTEAPAEDLMPVYYLLPED